MASISERTIARLSLYRRILDRFQDKGSDSIYSHELARQSGATPAQVRRDLMEVDYFGSAARGYRVEELIMAIDRTLDGPKRQLIGLVGVGNLGRAVLHYFAGRRRQLEIVAAL